MAGNTTAALPTMFWHSGLARNCTHFHASSLCGVPFQMASARPLYMLQLPSGPAGCGW